MLRFHTMMLAVAEKKDDREIPKALYEHALIHCYQSVSLFFEMGLLHDVHQSLICVIDLQTLFRVLYQQDVGSKSIDEIQRNIREIEKETGIPPYECIVESTYNELSKPQDSTKPWVAVKDEDIELYAIKILEAYDLPETRLIHIMNDIKAHKLFYEKCNNPDLLLFLDRTHEQTKNTFYASKMRYLIHNKKSGMESQWSTDINHLLDEFSLLMNNKN